ncbi:MAG: undecaprenyl-phosphate glucose phosphotransferase [Pseudomonadales bacterium]
MLTAIADAIIIALAATSMFSLIYAQTDAHFNPLKSVSAGISLFLLIAFCSGVYQSWRDIRLTEIMGRYTATGAISACIIMLYLVLSKTAEDYSRIWLTSTMLVTYGLGVGFRFIYYMIIRKLRAKGYNIDDVLLISHKNHPPPTNLAESLEHSGYHIARQYIIDDDIDDLTSELALAIDQSHAKEVWIYLPLAESSRINTILDALHLQTANIRYVPDLFSYNLLNQSTSQIGGIPVVNLSMTPMSGVNLTIKAVEDRLLSAFILIVLSPILIVLAIGVKISSPGPILYKQERISFDLRPIQMLKFRSMPVNTEENGVSWGGSDAKVSSAFGRFIRKTSLDELPQFINVLRGDMSIVGPRPERTIFVERLKQQVPDYMKKHKVKAGITGWAQINGLRGDTDLNARIEHDLYYIQNWSLWLDLKIILLTPIKGLINKNAY